MFNFKCWESQFHFLKMGNSASFRRLSTLPFHHDTTKPIGESSASAEEVFCVIYEKFIMTSVHFFFFSVSLPKLNDPQLNGAADFQTQETAGGTTSWHQCAPHSPVFWKAQHNKWWEPFFLPYYFEITGRRKLFPPSPPGAHLRGRKWGFRKPLTPGLHFHSIPTASS